MIAAVAPRLARRPPAFPTAMNLLLDTAPLAAGVLILFSTILCAQAPQQSTRKPCDPATEALLAKVAAQRGITQASGKEPTLRLEGDYSVSFEEQPEPVAKGRFVSLFSGSDLARQTSDMGQMGAMENGVHKDVVWAVDPMMGAKVHRGVNAATARRWSDIMRGQDPRTLYHQIAAAGTEKIDGREHTVLRMTPAEGKVDTWVVDADGNVARIHIALPAPESADAVFGLDDQVDAQVTFADWRQVDGGRFPFRTALKMGKATVSSTCDKVEVGAKIDPAKFTPPAAVAKVKPDATGPAFDKDGKPIYQLVDRQAQAVASIRIKIKPNEIAKQLGVMLPEVSAHLAATGANPAGPPFSRYHTFSDTEIDIEAGIPVHKPVTEKGRVKNSELPAGKVVRCWHIGPYEKLGHAHEGLQAHLTASKLTPRGGCWEIYWTDPGMVPDQAKWRTELFAPVE